MACQGALPLTPVFPPRLPACLPCLPACLQVHEATAELTANMNQEHRVCMTFVRDAFGFVLTPLQASGAKLLRVGGGQAVGGRGCTASTRSALELCTTWLVDGGLGGWGPGGLACFCGDAVGWPPRRPILCCLPGCLNVPPFFSSLPSCSPPLQKAVAIVRSYPFFPDIFSITTAAQQAQLAGTLGSGVGGQFKLLLSSEAAAAAAAAAAGAAADGWNGPSCRWATEQAAAAAAEPLPTQG